MNNHINKMEWSIAQGIAKGQKRLLVKTLLRIETLRLYVDDYALFSDYLQELGISEIQWQQWRDDDNQDF